MKKRDQQVAGGVVADEDHRRVEDGLLVLADQLAQRRLAFFLAVLHLLEDRALGDGAADQVADHDQHDREQERHPPAPGGEVFLGHAGVEEVQQAGGEDHADRDADLRVGAEQAALALRSVLHGHQGGAAPFTAGGEALDDAQQDQQDRGPDADLGVGRQHADQGRGGAHHDEGEDQHGLAAEAVAEVAGDDGAQRTEQEADADQREGQDLRQAGVGVVQRGEEQRGQQRCCQLGEDEEVVPLDGGADQGPGEDLAFLMLAAGARL